MPGRAAVRSDGLRVVAAVVVALAILAVAYVAWRQVAPASPAAGPVATARTSASARVTTVSRPPSQPAARASVDPVSGLPWIDAAALPPQARTVLTQIDRGGPYAYDKDGTVFRNAEGILPRQPSGFYKEYTVVLPGSSDRGPVRIVVGGRNEFFYWTTDHYETFSRIRR
jgi:ribonuclease T1